MTLSAMMLISESTYMDMICLLILPKCIAQHKCAYFSIMNTKCHGKVTNSGKESGLHSVSIPLGHYCAGGAAYKVEQIITY